MLISELASTTNINARAREGRRRLIAYKRQGLSIEEVMLVTPTLYVVFHGIRGSRINGSHLVNARNKKEANQIVRALDSDYIKIISKTLSEVIDEYGEIEYFIPQNKRIPEPSQAEFIEAGT